MRTRSTVDPHAAAAGGGAPALFAGPGEMRALCRAHDWSATALGPVEGWTQSLRVTAGIVLDSRNPMFLFWGPELVQLYNDAYRPSLGEGGRHPRALGARGQEFWTDIWGTIGPQIDQVMTRGEATWHEDQYLPIERNGRLEDVWWTYSYSPVRDDDGAIGGTLVVCQETTRRVLAEIERERHQTENASLAALVRASGEAMMGVGFDMRIESWNPAAQRLFGYEPQDIIGRPVSVLAPPELHAEQRELYAVITAGRTVSRETVRVARDGRRLDVILTIGLVSDAAGRPLGISAALVDITDRKRVEAELAEREARLRAIYDGTFEYIGLLAPDGTILEANRASLEFALNAREEVVGRRFWDTPWFEHTEGAADAVREGVARAAAGEFVRYEAVLSRPNGEQRAYDISLYPVRDERGEVVYVVPEGRDVSELVRARRDAERLREAAEAARADSERANRAKSEFMAVMSHELRTPLNAIGGYAELMELGIHGPVTDAQREDISRIQASQRHLLGLINQVLNHARLETGSVRYDISEVLVRDALAVAEGLVAPQARARGISLVVADCGRVAVRADADKLRQILLNMLSNAVKFTGSGGTVTLGCDATAVERDGRIRLVVRDTGIGIPPDKLEAVFEPFVQVDSRLTRAAEGTGLGLSISRNLARGMGGDLVVESVFGDGSTFTLVLPAA